ncbi:MAG: SgcJ/EcaC family oxidoreductase [Imperialibacter sp.]
MKAPLLLVLCVFAFHLAFGQVTQNDKAITKLIDQYSEARETKDTVLLKDILTEDIDQLVSNGEWRIGIRVAIDGMMRSSTSNPGSRTLTIDKIRYLGPANAIADCRYEIKNPDGSERKMWSTFVVVKQKGKWRISAIRNMLPAG